jgi:hypothetical protein
MRQPRSIGVPAKSAWGRAPRRRGAGSQVRSGFRIRSSPSGAVVASWVPPIEYEAVGEAPRSAGADARRLNLIVLLVLGGLLTYAALARFATSAAKAAEALQCLALPQQGVRGQMKFDGVATGELVSVLESPAKRRRNCA